MKTKFFTDKLEAFEYHEGYNHEAGKHLAWVVDGPSEEQLYAVVDEETAAELQDAADTITPYCLGCPSDIVYTEDRRDYGTHAVSEFRRVK